MRFSLFSVESSGLALRACRLACVILIFSNRALRACLPLVIVTALILAPVALVADAATKTVFAFVALLADERGAVLTSGERAGEFVLGGVQVDCPRGDCKKREGKSGGHLHLVRHVQLGCVGSVYVHTSETC